jgi:hypothetical protein
MLVVTIHHSTSYHPTPCMVITPTPFVATNHATSFGVNTTPFGYGQNKVAL